MTQIDFYVLPDEGLAARLMFVCRLIDKVQRLNHTNNSAMSVLVAVDSEADAKELDNLLWTFKPESFVPHQLINPNKPAEIEITHTQEIGDHQDLLINLCTQVPTYFSRFERLVEVVIQDATLLESSRERFGFYKSRGYPIETKKM